MPTQFQRPNKTKSLFAQIDSQRPQYARTKLAGAEGAVGMLRNSADANNKEGQNVTNQQAMVNSQTDKGVTNLQMAPKLDNAQGQAKNANNYGNSTTPVFINQIAGGGGVVKGEDGTFYDKNGTFLADDTIKNQSTFATDQNNKTKSSVDNTIGDYRGQLGQYKDGALGKELSKIYGTESEQLEDSRKMATEGNLGTLADESDFEMEQEKLASVLADRESNIGKLKALYGVGYDSTKYGALDSNVLQGQFNDLQGSARDGLKAKDDAQKTLSRTKESYLDNIDTQKSRLDKQQQETTDRITTIDAEIGEAQNALNDLEQRTDSASKDAAGKLKESIRLKTEEKEKLVKETEKDRYAYSATAFQNGGDSLQKYFQSTTNLEDVKAIKGLNETNQSPKEKAKFIADLSPEALQNLNPNQSLISLEEFKIAANTTNDKIKKEKLLNIIKALSNGNSQEDLYKAEADRREAERKKRIKDQQDTNKNIASGGLYNVSKKLFGE